jgi:hypothetical protein
VTTLITAYKTQLDLLLAADDDLLSAEARIRNIRAAAERFSLDHPNRQTDDVTGTAGRYYELGSSTVLAAWSQEFSRIVSIQYPAPTVASNETPVYLEPEDWQDNYQAGGKRYLYLPNHAPALTEAMRIEYTVPWAWTVSTTAITVTQAAHGFVVNDYVYHNGTTYVKGDVALATHQVTVAAPGTPNQFTAKELQADVPAAYFHALCYLAAAICCQAMAARFAKTSDSTILVDGTRTTSNSQEFANRGTEFLRLYQQAIGPAEEKKSEGAGNFVDWDTAPGWPGNRQFVFHGRGIR